MKMILVIISVLSFLFHTGCRNSDEYLKNGIRKLDKGEYLAAIEDFNAAIDINPKYDTAYYYRGQAKERRTDILEAINDYSKAIEINPKYVDALFIRGKAKCNLDDYLEAIEDYNRILEINPGNDKAYESLGRAKYYLNNYMDALDDYNKAIEINPKNAIAINGRGLVFEKLGKYQEALADYSESSKLDYLTGGWFNKDMLQSKIDLEKLDNIILKDPKNSEAFYKRGIIKYKKSDFEGACNDWKKANSLGNLEANEYIEKHCR